jgi:4-nitrophenyl phosphatase
MSIDLSQFKAVLLDLDGTLYYEERPLPGAVALLRQLQRKNVNYACISNATTSPERIVLRLAKMGIEAPASKIYTASASAADLVMSRFGGAAIGGGAIGGGAIGGGGAPAPSAPRTPRVFNLATDGLQEMLDGRVVWVQTDAEPCDAVIIGAPSNAFAGEERQRLALRLLRKGAAAIGVCADRVYPSARGLEFGSGAFTAMLCYAANAKPTFCGKPQPAFFTELCRRLSTSPAQCVLIGDNLESDIAGAKAVGMKTILTLTGVTRRRDLLQAPAEMKPDQVIEDLTELVEG